MIINFNGGGGGVSVETDPAFNASTASSITSTDINNWNNAVSTANSISNTVNDIELVDASDYAKTSDIPSLDGYAKTSDIPSLDGYAKTDDVYSKSEIDTKLGSVETELASI